MVLVRIPGAQLIVDVEKSSNLELDSKFTSKEATIEDLDALIDICLNDASVSNFGKEGLENFVKSNLFN